MQAFDDPEKPVICPYDKNHTIFVSKFAFHLTRCRKNHPGAPIAICDYNHDHRIPKPELQYHLETCPDRHIMESRSLESADDHVMSFPIKNLMDPCEEKWDDAELDHPGYNYEEHTQDRNVLRNMAVEARSVKREFRRTEQTRMQSLNNPTGARPDIPGYSEPSNSKATALPSSSFHVDEEKPELSLADRIHKDRTVYESTDPNAGFKFPKKSRKNKKH